MCAEAVRGRGRRGASALTYGILVGLVAVASLSAMAGGGAAVNRLFGTVSGRLGDVTAGPRAPTVPTSCADHRAQGNAGLDVALSIDPDGAGPGGSVSVTCDNATDGGGWMRLLEADEPRLTTGSPATVLAVNDAVNGFTPVYTQVLLKTRGNWLFNYARTNSSWSMTGINPYVHGLRLEVAGVQRWTFKAGSPTWRGCDGIAANNVSTDNLTTATYPVHPAANYAVVTAVPGVCNQNGTDVSAQCGTVLRVTLPAGARLRGFSDLESVANVCAGDNAHEYDVGIYVR